MVPFDWRVTKDRRVLVYRAGKLIMALGGPRGLRLADDLDGADEEAAQQLLARATGHYRHGNERGPHRS